MAAAMPLAKPRKPRTPPRPMGMNHRQYLGIGRPGVGQHLHKGAVDVEHHRQHTAGHPRQNGAGPDQDPAQQVPQPADAKILIPLSLSTPFLHLYLS